MPIAARILPLIAGLGLCLPVVHGLGCACSRPYRTGPFHCTAVGVAWSLGEGGGGAHSKKFLGPADCRLFSFLLNPLQAASLHKMWSRILLTQLLLGCSPAIGSILANQGGQQPLGIWNPSSSSSSSSSKPNDIAKAPAYRDALLDLHKRLVEIPSTSGLEHDAGDFLVDYFISKSWNYEVQPVEPEANTPSDKGRFNVVAWPPAASSAHDQKPTPKVLVTSHIDCVPPHIPYGIASGPVTKDTLISGRCSVDAKGSVAAQITAVHDLLAAGHLAPEDVMLLFVVGEERNGAGMRAFNDSPAHHSSVRAVVFGEPTENRLACGHKGTFSCDVTATGKAGHSGYPWLGKSANEVLMRGLVRMLDTDLGSSDQYGNTTVNVGTMAGGVAGNVIPAHASAQLTIRVALEPEDGGHKIVVENIKRALASVDDEAIAVQCTPGIGVVQCDCDVDGKSISYFQQAKFWYVCVIISLTGLLFFFLFFFQALRPWWPTMERISISSRATTRDTCTGLAPFLWPTVMTRR